MLCSKEIYFIIFDNKKTKNNLAESDNDINKTTFE